MQNAYIVTGTLSNTHTVELDEALPLPRVKVRVVVEPIEQTVKYTYGEVMAEIRLRQRHRKHEPPIPEEVDAYLQAERASWGK